MTSPEQPLDRWLDQYEASWSGSASPPALAEFVSRVPAESANAEEVIRELALIENFQNNLVAGLPYLPSWQDYAGVPSCDADWVEGICHEYRVRQAFGDRPHYREFMAKYAFAEAQLSEQLPALAARLTRAMLTLTQVGQPAFTCQLPARVEIGRRRVGEPMPPALIGHPPRLLIADLPVTHISRAHCEVEVVAKGRVLIRHLAAKGNTSLSTGESLAQYESREVNLPVDLSFRGRLVRVEQVK